MRIHKVVSGTHLIFAHGNQFVVVVPVRLDHLLELPAVNTILDRVASGEHKPGRGMGGKGRGKGTRAQCQRGARGIGRRVPIQLL